MISKFIAHNVVTMGASVLVTALDDQGVVWVYEPFRFRTGHPEDATKGVWRPLSKVRETE